MSDASADHPPDQRPRVVGSFVEPDESDRPLLLAIGKVVVAVAGLEKAMQLELTRLLCEQHIRRTEASASVLERRFSQLNKLSGGELLKQLRALDLPSHLCDRIDDAVHRRNKLVHHMYEDSKLATVIVDGGDTASIVKRFERLALDCAELAVELQLFALPRLEALFGTTRAGMIEMIRSMDPSAVADARDREQLKTLQAMTDLDGLAAALDELDGGTASGPDAPFQA